MMTTIPDDIRESAERVLDDFCSDAVPGHARDERRVGYLIRGVAITLFEIHSALVDSSHRLRIHVAGFKYSETRAEWTLYWLDRGMEWRVYDEVEPSPDMKELLREATDDPECVFWGCV